MRLLLPSFTGRFPFISRFRKPALVRATFKSRIFGYKVGDLRAASALAAVKEYSETAKLPISTGFEGLGLSSDLLSAIRERSFEAPTEIQARLKDWSLANEGLEEKQIQLQLETF